MSNMPDRATALFEEIAATTAAGTPVAMATVIATSRSVPRHASSRMLVHLGGSQTGTIGGGEMEARVIDVALDVIATGTSRVMDFDLVDPSSGDPGVCGGTVSIYVEAFMPEATIFVVGCGHVGKAVVDLAHWLGYRVVATDDRPELATTELVPNADVVSGGSIASALETSPITSNTDVVVVTRNVQVDLEILPVLLASEARSVGVMGSTRRWATTSAKLIEAGIDAHRLATVRAPIGIELHAETPAEIALSIMSEIVQSRRSTVE
jgi:xanthine dehydrogenase accessory factor